MADKVNFYPESRSVSINGKRYTQKELEDLPAKNKLENGVLRTLKEIMQEPKVINLAQIEIEYEDVSELVKSDMAKGDYHSTPLLNGTTDQVFWEHN